jgi:sporulation protein YlmC with PRC-barrel domain
MPLPDIDTALDWRGRNVIDRNGEKIGKFEELYLDEETAKPEWAAVATGRFGRKQSLIPLSEARLEGNDLQVPFDEDQVKDAPALDPDTELSQEEERQLYSHYGIEYSMAGSETVLPESGSEGDGEAAGAEGEERTQRTEAGAEQPTGGETSADEGAGAGAADGDDDGESAQTGDATPAGVAGAASRARDSEQSPATSQEGAGTSGEAEGSPGEAGLRVGTEVKPRERVRLRKYVVTEEVTKKVPVTREEVRLEREPVGEGEETPGEVAEGEEQVVLSEEEPVIQEPEETSDQRDER